ncbi:porin [Sneathiella marina]|uniref:Porin n=1 Tax=Sneathiella marina TaxID=2950108 RepID=A0ABY4W394_9PROT|nr:porin [Sneathiella marina]USG61432.1 porin [Sneathiella marina]
MKKAILGTTALVAVSALAVGNASAADKIKLGVGGYMQSTYYYADYDQDKGSAPTSENLERISDRVTQEGEVFFTGSTTLDNGLKIGANIQLEAYAASADQIDETYIFIQGSFGRVLFGSEDGAAYLMHYDAPSPVPMYSADSPNIYPIGVTNSTRGTMFSDKDKISYFTPRFAGFQLGGSYVPDGSSETGQHSVYAPTQLEGGLDRGYSLAVNYVNKFGGVDLALSAGYNSAEIGKTQTYTGAFAFDPATGGSTKTSTTAYTTSSAAEDQSEYTLGAQVGFAGFTVGGGYRKQLDIGGVKDADKKTYSAGVKYGMGPWAVGVQYSNSEVDVTSGPKPELENWVIGGQYTLGPGITAFGGVELYDNTSGSGIEGDSQIYFIGTALSF